MRGRKRVKGFKRAFSNLGRLTAFCLRFETREVGNGATKEAMVATSMKELFEIVDRMDPDGFAECFTADGRFRFGNAPTVSGRGGISESVGQFFSSLKSLRHDIQDLWEQGDVVITEVEATYLRADGHEVTLPAVTVARLEDELIRDYRIYMDINPLFEASA